MSDLSARLDSLRARTAALTAAEEIKTLHRNYIRDLADRRFETMTAYFADDAVVDLRSHGPRRGQAAIRELFQQMHDSPFRDAGGYLLTSPILQVDNDTAVGEWTWHRHICEFATPAGITRVWGPWLEARYWCTYARRDGAWKFTHVRFRVILPDPDEE
jgi:ketosteroid isomerase-like protein